MPAKNPIFSSKGATKFLQDVRVEQYLECGQLQSAGNIVRRGKGGRKLTPVRNSPLLQKTRQRGEKKDLSALTFKTVERRRGLQKKDINFGVPMPKHADVPAKGITAHEKWDEKISLFTFTA